MDVFQRITCFLRTLRRRLDRVSLSVALLAAVLTGLVAASVSVSLAYLGGAAASEWAWAVSGLGLGVASLWVWRLWWIPRRGRRTDEAMARWVERQVAGLDSGVITSVQVADLLEASLAGHAPLRFSPKLAVATAQRTAARLEALSLSELVDRTRLVFLVRLAVLAVLCVALWFKLSPQVWLVGFDHMRGLGIEGTPIEEVDAVISDLHLEILPPAYLGQEPKKITRTGGDLVALSGTQVVFSARVLVPSGLVTLLLASDPQGRWPLEHGGEGVVEGRLKVGASDRYRFMVQTPEGRLLRERRWRTVDVRLDHAPEVRLHQPDTDVEVHEADEIACFYEASDDHGLAQVDLVVVPMEGGEEIRRRVASGDGLRVKRGAYSVGASELALAPGESAELYVEARDRNDVTGPGVGRSNRRVVTMYSPDAKHEALLVGLSALVDAMIDLLADRLESPIMGVQGRQLAPVTAWHQALTARQWRVLESFRVLVANASVDPFAPEKLLTALRGAHDQLQGVHDQEIGQLTRASRPSSSPRDARIHLTMLDQVNHEGIGVTEGGILSLKDLVDESRQNTVLDKGRTLLDAQLELMDLLEQMRDGDSPQLKAKVEAKLRELEANLARMQQEMQKLAEHVPYENQNPQEAPAGTQSDMQDIASELEAIRALMAAGRVEEALARLESLTRSTQALMAALQDDFSQGDPAMAAGTREMAELSESVQELADAQQLVHDETAEVQQRLEAAALEEMKARLDAELDAMLEQATKLKKGLGECSGGGLYPQDRQTLEQLREGASMLKRAIEGREIADGLDQAKRIAENAPALGAEILAGEEREMNMERARQMRNAREHLERAGGQASDLAEWLSRLLPEPTKEVSGEARREMRKLKQRQSQLHKEAAKVHDRLDAVEEHVPGLRGEMEEILKGAGEAMEEARHGLGQQDAGRAMRHQREALDRLGEARQALERRLSQQPSDGRQQGVGVSRSPQRVEIPDQGDGTPQVEFRQELLRAMQEVAPEAFKESIKRYYEELVR